VCKFLFRFYAYFTARFFKKYKIFLLSKSLHHILQPSLRPAAQAERGLKLHNQCGGTLKRFFQNVWSHLLPGTLRKNSTIVESTALCITHLARLVNTL
jgi:hypothetical protein